MNGYSCAFCGAPDVAVMLSAEGGRVIPCCHVCEAVEPWRWDVVEHATGRHLGRLSFMPSDDATDRGFVALVLDDQRVQVGLDLRGERSALRVVRDADWWEAAIRERGKEIRFEPW